ncbi:hypothetical protein [Gottfriedia acidiceleris]
MKPKSEKYPDGFDYKIRLEVLETNEIVLPGGSVLESNRIIHQLRVPM